MNKIPMVFALSGDVGGAGAIIPVIKALSEEGLVRLKISAYGPSIQAFEKAGIEVISIPESWTISDAKMNWYV